MIKPVVTWLGTMVFEATGDHHHVFEVSRITGGSAEINIPAEIVDDPRALRRTLISKGAQLPKTKEASDILLRGLIDGDVPKLWRVPRQAGWVKSEAFMIGNRVIGTPDAGYRLPPGNVSGDWYSQSGSLNDWKDNVAKRARFSSVMMTTICVPFAAIVKHLVGMQNFVLGIAGPGKSGKSTCLVVAASVYGIGTEQGLPNFNATNLSIQEVASSFNSLMLPLNELGLVGGPKATLYESVVRPLIFCYAEGSPRRRSEFTSASMKGTGKADPWHGILAYTSEDHLAELAKLGSVKRYAGERARCHEMPATHGSRSTVFDSWPKDVEKSKRKKWERDSLSCLRIACEKHHGTAIDAFVTRVIDRGETFVRKALDKRMEEFLAMLKPVTLAPEVAHAAKNFALLYAAGVFGIKADVLPWSTLELRSAIMKAFRSVHPEAVDSLEQGKSRLSKILASPSFHRKAKGTSTSPVSDCIGYQTAEGVIHVHARSFKKRFEKAELAALLAWLQKSGLLKPKKGKAPGPCSKATDWAECTVKWPDGNVHRTIIFRRPFPNVERLK